MTIVEVIVIDKVRFVGIVIAIISWPIMNVGRGWN
jgi:hypothetical protein